jgi:hypothetical protein
MAQHGGLGVKAAVWDVYAEDAGRRVLGLGASPESRFHGIDAIG